MRRLLAFLDPLLSRTTDRLGKLMFVTMNPTRGNNSALVVLDVGDDPSRLRPFLGLGSGSSGVNDH